MTSRPIPFSGAMVMAILSGAKTQTRRILKGSTEHRGPYNPEYLEAHRNSPGWASICPYGQPGDLLWVRETWTGNVYDDKFHYKATDEGDFVAPPKWRPSIHMPRSVSRITLSIESVRVERLQDISAADCISEGIGFEVRYGGHCLPDGSHFHTTDPRISYWSLWDAINGQGSVEANPFVWALAFKRVQP